MPADTSVEVIKGAFGAVEMIRLDDVSEKAFVTDSMTEYEYQKAADSIGNVINMIRLD